MRCLVLLAALLALLGSVPAPAAAVEPATFKRVAQATHGRYYAARGQRVDVRRNEEFLARLFSLFGPAPAGWRVEYYRHASVADLERRIGFAAYGVTDLEALRIDSVHDYHPHELVHAVAGRLGQPPLLFTEGLAVALSAQGLWRGRDMDALAREHMVAGGSLDRLLRTFAEQDPDRDYAVAGSFVAFLLDRGGIEPLVRFLAGCGRDPGRYEAALRAAYGHGLADLEFEWLRRLRTAQPTVARAWYDAGRWPEALRPERPTATASVSAPDRPVASAAPSTVALEPAAGGRSAFRLPSWEARRRPSHPLPAAPPR